MDHVALSSQKTIEQNFIENYRNEHLENKYPGFLGILEKLVLEGEVIVASSPQNCAIKEHLLSIPCIEHHTLNSDLIRYRFNLHARLQNNGK